MSDPSNGVDLPSLFINGATLVAALSAAYFSHRAIALQSKQRLAEFRKEWIENLRIHISEFAAASYSRAKAKERLVVYSSGKTKNTLLAREWREKYMKFTEEVARHNSYIKLCLNDGEIEHAALIKKMKQYVDEEYGAVKQGAKLNDLARAVMKKEWDRLKAEL
jgi:hypothetical protein